MLAPTAVALALLAGVSLAATASGSSDSAAQSTAATGFKPTPEDDAFYTPPSPLPQGKPGDIIRARPAKAGPPTARSLANAWQIMYLSTDALGKPNAVTGMVFVPKAVSDPSQLPVIGFAPGTQGSSYKCAPSLQTDHGSFYEQAALKDMLTAGYAVAMTDWEGYHPKPTTTYMTGKAMGPALIDAVRAAQRLPEGKLSADSKVVFRGFSQGGGGSAWAGQLQPTYAPELKLIGVVAGGVPADLVQVGLPLNGKFGYGLYFNALIGLDHAYPELKMDSYLNDAGKAAVADFQDNSCVYELLKNYSGKQNSDYFAKNPLTTQEWGARLKENKLGAEPIKVPVFQYHGTKDQLVAFNQASKLRDTYCAAGVNLTWKTYETDHLTGISRGNADAMTFIADRLAGTPATPNCPTTA
ncbi:lipase family protein [Streptomyces sp. B1866]|uniref:lipase family protein n=1 Tax=Streptomyces sp. B1866 TaxID=3075431 RepID=UPI0028A1D0DF|nr:lipase family protein [Streptomyces sp. B1866]